jgi:predicted methyltransferase
MIRTLTATVVLLCSALSLPAAAASPLEAAIGAKHRSPEFVQRDAARHPLETLQFFGIEPDMTVVEIWPGAGGWYTEILAPLLRASGRLYAAQYNRDSPSQYYRESRAQFEAKLAANPAVYDRVVVTSFNPPAHVDIAPPGSADLVLTFRNVHNWYMRGGGDERVIAAFQAMHRALRPGGVLGVVEHRLPASRPLADQEDSGYLREDYVIDMAQRAGFELVAKSEINANPKDKADHPKGVWTLPPTLRLGEVERDKYLAIGESDRMTLKFRKP